MLSDLTPVLVDIQKTGKLLIKVMVTPNKQRTKLKKVVRSEHYQDFIWILYVDIVAQPERGEANKELCTFLAKLFYEHTVHMTSGHTSKEKYFLLT